MNVFMLTLIISQVIYVCGNVIVIREQLNSNNTRKVICISENDGAALIWNTFNFKSDDSSKTFQEDKVLPTDECRLTSTRINCNMDKEESCLKSWNTQYWKSTNSFETPMGPVFDQRWEEFEEYRLSRDDEYHLNVNNIITAVISFSIRTNTDLHILLCNSVSRSAKYCYWIIIGGWRNTKSIIRRCPTGVPEYGEKPMKNTECYDEKVSLEHKPLSEFEWRTFVITFNHAIRKISVYDSNDIIMSYTDSRGPSFHYSMSIRGEYKLIRFHEYEFLYTIVEDATLISPRFNESTICVQLLIGLCVECDANIVLYDELTNNIIQSVTVKGSSVAAVHLLPMWQSVRIEQNLSIIDSSGIRIHVIPKLNAISYNPLWAIANVRQCSPDGCFRIITDNIVQEADDGAEYFWHNITCQKLFYNENTVVKSFSNITSDIKLENVKCPTGHIGPKCLINCVNNSLGFECKKAAICYKNGCKCITGSECREFCKKNYYGQYCDKKCGQCNQTNCDPVTGVCNYGCKNTENRVYIQPLCQIGIDKPKSPQISTNHMNIMAVVPMIWKNEYEETKLSYSFGIKNSSQTRNTELVRREKWKGIFRNTTQLVGYFKNLQPGNYKIACFLSVGEVVIRSDWQSVDINCNNASPKITNLEIAEVDTRKTPANIYLRWQYSPSLHSKLSGYQIISCSNKTDGCSHFNIEANESCTLWEFHICKVIQGSINDKIFVATVNGDFCKQSTSNVVTVPVINNTMPDVPRSYVYTINDNSIVDLKWLHPWRTGGHLQCFRIKIEEISSSLKDRNSKLFRIYEQPVTNYTRNYSERLYLLPSTEYLISIQSVTTTNQSSRANINGFRTPATTNLDDNLIVESNPSNFTILVWIPKVLNDTRDSWIHIIVIGDSHCKRYSKLSEDLLAQVNLNKTVWQVAEGPTDNFAGKVFKIDGDETVNCPLIHEQTYEIVIIIADRNLPDKQIILMKRTSVFFGSNQLMNYINWTVPILLILSISITTYCIYRRH